MHELIFLQRKYRKKYRILNSKWIIDVYCISSYYNFIYMFYETYCSKFNPPKDNYSNSS